MAAVRYVGSKIAPASEMGEEVYFCVSATEVYCWVSAKDVQEHSLHCVKHCCCAMSKHWLHQLDCRSFLVGAMNQTPISQVVFGRQRWI